jgi:predicted ATPase
MSEQTLAEQITVARRKRRQDAAVVYREALLKGTLSEGEEETVAGAMEALGRSINDLQSDTELVRRIAQWSELAGQVETLQEEGGRKRAALTDAQREYEQALAAIKAEWEPKLAQLQRALSQTHSRATEASQARSDLAMLQARWENIVAGE